MARMRKLPLEEWDESLAALTDRPQIGMFPILAHNPPIAKAVMDLYGALAKGRRLPQRLLEIVRLRIAYRNQCRTCIAVRYGSDIEPDLDDAAVCALEKPLDSELFSAAEKAAIIFADRMATDHLSVDDEVYAALLAHFSEAEVVELAAHVAVLIGFGRLTATLNLVDQLPEEYRSDSPAEFAPWLNAGIAFNR
jgi:alkylhydroperoxidase family enzyme